MIVGDRPRRLEICTDSPAGVAAAIAGGADRIELCSALEIGGLTPSAGLVAEVRDATRSAGVALVAMVRPRGGDFTYDDAELALAIAEAQALIAQGVDGLVFGAVRDGQVDMAASAHWMEQVREAAGMPLPCTFHRAIDLLADPVDAVDAITALGFTRILTSGGALRAIDGVDVIARMVGAGRVARRCGIDPRRIWRNPRQCARIVQGDGRPRTSCLGQRHSGRRRPTARPVRLFGADDAADRCRDRHGLAHGNGQ